MTRVLVFVALAAVAAGITSCGTERIRVASSDPLHEGAVLFSQRCAGCHTFSYAATHGSAANVRSAQPNNGPNFDIRCEWPPARVLYAIENGGFSGAYMPQNVVVGQDAIKVAEFVATYSGRSAPIVPGAVSCSQQKKTLPAAIPPLQTATATATAPSTATATIASTGTAKPKHAKKKKK